jgi:hypothetical protein
MENFQRFLRILEDFVPDVHAKNTGPFQRKAMRAFDVPAQSQIAVREETAGRLAATATFVPVPFQ